MTNQKKNDMLLPGLMLAIALVISTTPVPSVAQPGCVGGPNFVYFSVDGNYNSFTNTGSGIVNVSVWVSAVPATKVRVTLDPPPFPLVGISYNYPVTGYPNAEFDLGECQAGAYPLMTFSVFMINPGCAQWAPLSAEIDACTGETFTAEILPTEFGVSGCTYVLDACPSVVPYDLFPSNGAVDVPLDAELSWNPTLAPFVDCWVVINTEPSCEGGQQFVVPCDDPRFSPDFLLPGTTYYWYAAYFETGSGCAIGGGAASTMHSFTTSGSVAVEPSTWGAIKSMYAE